MVQKAPATTKSKGCQTSKTTQAGIPEPHHQVRKMKNPEETKLDRDLKEISRKTAAEIIGD
ncbi:hypothetical protein [Candidatus Formimonas warabiya]|uniref:Uncharacterized protein n=1 Tax=Formimonas warabiya TaxID=1761012 RepID=A0A3G1KVI3_FORW1|nr:hypothetical protein [Candidatus Formimonas warabiya]ATW26420.1 hypothetical protein DCMF_18160 [Candidatus Formimonas warabiya]